MYVYTSISNPANLENIMITIWTKGITVWVTIFWLLTEQSMHNKQNTIHILYWYFVSSSTLNVNVGILTKQVMMGIILSTCSPSIKYKIPAKYGLYLPSMNQRKLDIIKSVEQCQTWSMWTDTTLPHDLLVQRTSLSNTHISEHVVLSFIQTQTLSSSPYPFSKCQ